MRTPLAAISDKVDSARQQRLGVDGVQLIQIFCLMSKSFSR